LIYLKALLEKPIQTFYYSLKNSIEKIRFQNTILFLFKSYASIFARKYFTNGLCQIKFTISKRYLKIKSYQVLFPKP
jgi:hypothetical protein